MHKRNVVLAVAMILVSFPVSHVWAQGEQDQRDSLRGLLGVAVEVAPMRMYADAERDGLTTDAIRTAVELRLREAGITVFSGPTEDAAGPAYPYLYVSVNTNKLDGSSDGLYAPCVSVELSQVMTSRVTGAGVYGVTWQRGGVWTVESARLRNMRDSIKDNVDKFINDWLTVHPK